MRVKKILKYLMHPSWVLVRFSERGIIFLPDRLFLRLQFRRYMGKKLDLNNPKTFNEKLQWLKLYDRKPEYTKLVDKYEVKKIVAKVLGEKYIIPTYGIYDRFNEIDFEKLPNSFVIKTTHFGGSNGVFIVKDKTKMNTNKIKKGINSVLKKNLYYYSREWPYKKVKPRIIIEEYVDMGEGNDIDYKFMCFNGVVKCIFTCTERFSESSLKVTFFDTKWNMLPFERDHPKSKKTVLRPPALEKMIELSEKLSKGIPFVRVDFYNPEQDIIKFGEMTLYPGAGLESFQPETWDRKLGDLIKLPEKHREK